MFISLPQRLSPVYDYPHLHIHIYSCLSRTSCMREATLKSKGTSEIKGKIGAGLKRRKNRLIVRVTCSLHSFMHASRVQFPPLPPNPRSLVFFLDFLPQLPSKCSDNFFFFLQNDPSTPSYSTFSSCFFWCWKNELISLTIQMTTVPNSLIIHFH